jgi:ankyrin repeat protein
MKKPDEKMLQELQRAIEANAPALLRPLIEAGVPVDQRIGDSPRRTLREFAVEMNAVDVAKFLITAGAKLDTELYKPLIHAALFNRMEIIQLLLDAGADPDISISTPEEDLRYETALMHAVDRPEKIPVVELLLRHKADPNLTTN